jgi:DNA primase
LTDDTTGNSRIQEQKIVQRLAGKFRVDEQELRRRLTDLRRRTASRPVMVRSEAPSQPAVEVTVVKLAEIDPWERELLELLIAHPEFVSAASQQIGPEHWTADACRRIFETSCHLNDEGIQPTFERLMLEFDEPGMKNLLVALDENAQAKGRAEADPTALWEQMLKTLQRKETEKQRPAQLVALREGGLDVTQQAAMLQAILSQERNRHGIAKPTDG